MTYGHSGPYRDRKATELRFVLDGWDTLQLCCAVFLLVACVFEMVLCLLVVVLSAGWLTTFGYMALEVIFGGAFVLLAHLHHGLFLAHWLSPTTKKWSVKKMSKVTTAVDGFSFLKSASSHNASSNLRRFALVCFSTGTGGPLGSARQRTISPREHCRRPKNPCGMISGAISPSPPSLPCQATPLLGGFNSAASKPQPRSAPSPVMDPDKLRRLALEENLNLNHKCAVLWLNDCDLSEQPRTF